MPINLYQPEPYWNDVAKRIAGREDHNVIAGDDEPYYRYKRKKFLKLLDHIDFRKKTVLELGSGPGGNLYQIMKKGPKELHGADISDEMINLAKKTLGNTVTITKIDGRHLPFPDNYFDLVLTSTVLQHNTDEDMLHQIVKEICRVSRNEIYLFEKIEKKLKGTALCMGRPVSYYENLLRSEGFDLKEVRFLNVQVSFMVSGSIRKIFNSGKKKEGEPVTKLASFLQTISLPLTSALDNIFKAKREVAMLYFTRMVKD